MVAFVGGNAEPIGEIIEGVKKKIEWDNSGQEGYLILKLFTRARSFAMDEGDLGSWGRTLGTLLSPCFWVATVTVASRLARNEEADTVVVVVAFTGAPSTQDTALIECSL